MRRFIRAVGAGVVLIVLVAGFPLGLAVTVGNPLSGWADLQAGDVSDTVIVDVLATMTWLAWAQFAWAVASEVLALAHRAPAPDLPELRTGPQHAARALVTAAFVALPVAVLAHDLTGAGAAAGRATIVTLASAPRTNGFAGADVASGGPGSSSSPVSTLTVTGEGPVPPSGPEPTAAQAPTPTAAARTREIMIRADGPRTYWDLAVAHLGDGQRWPEIWVLNAGRVQGDGRAMASPGLLRTGWTVLLPAPTSDRPDLPDRPATVDTTDGTTVYIVASGDWLGSIAQRFLGDFHDYPRLIAANPDLFTAAGSGAHGVLGDHIEPGWHLTLPAGARDRGQVRHAAGPGPSPANPPSGTTGSPAPDRPSRPPGSTEPPSPHPTGKQTPGPERSAAAPAPRPGRHTAAPTPTAAPSTAPGSGTTPPTGTPHLVPGPQDTNLAGGDTPGIALPGGWLDLPLAGAVLAAAAVIWRRRWRRNRSLTSRSGTGSATTSLVEEGDEDPDADLRPLPGVITHLRRAVRAHAATVHSEPRDLPTLVPVQGRDVDLQDTDGRSDPDSGPADAGQARMPRMVGPGPVAVRPHARHAEAASRGPRGTGARHVAVGITRQRKPPTPRPPQRGAEPVGLGPIPALGMGLIGPGALGAARALLVAALTTPAAQGPGVVGQILTTTETLRALFPSGSTIEALVAGRAADPRVQVAGTLEEALTRLESHLLERSRHHEHDAQYQDGTHPHDGQMPPLMLLTSLPPAAIGARLAADLTLGAGLHVSAVLLGRWQHAPTATVSAEGYTTDTATATSARRIAVLDEATALDLLRALTDTHPPDPVPEPATDHPPAEPATSTGAQAGSPDPLTSAQAAPRPGPGPVLSTGQPGTTAETIDSAGGGAPGAARVSITLFAAPTIWDRHGAPVPGLRQHARELLVYLAVHPEGAELPELMEAFWPDATLRRAGERLSTEVGDLRRRIREAADNKTLQPVINTGGHYHLDPALLDIDVWRLLDHLAHASATTDPTTRAHSLRSAVAVSTAELAEGQDYDWIHVHREHLRRERIRARQQLAAHPDTSTSEAAALLDAAAALDPTDEDLAQRAVRALTDLGDTDAAQRRLQSLRAALKAIDTQPSNATRRLMGNRSRGVHRA